LARSRSGVSSWKFIGVEVGGARRAARRPVFAVVESRAGVVAGVSVG
jgi:hypothetical protein